MNELSLRQALAIHYQYLVDNGLNELSSGNISARFEGGMLISPTGAGAGIKADEFVATSLDGEWQGDRRPSSEWRMHAAVYLAMENTQAVVHTHSDHCVALSCHNRPLPGFHYLVGSFGGSDVPCIPYATFGTDELASSTVEALSSRRACLLGNHGMISRGRNLDQAVTLAHRLEIMCRQYLLACQFGEPELLNESQWEEFFSKASEYPSIEFDAD